jgi:p-hydroxybenzoate 3-monooxygenase
MNTQVGIIGAGPAGLLLGPLLHLKGIDSVILETRNKEYVIDRVRAGVLEQFTADLMTQMGVGERLHREGMRHDCVYLSFGGKRITFPFPSSPAARQSTFTARTKS